MMPPHCAETALDAHMHTRYCSLEVSHGGDHMDWHGNTWQDPADVLPRLQARWGRTHHIAWTGRLWLATDRRPRSHWATEVEPTPDLLEQRLEAHHGPPPGATPTKKETSSHV